MHEDADLGGNVLLAVSIAMAGHSVIGRQVLNAVYAVKLRRFYQNTLALYCAPMGSDTV